MNQEKPEWANEAFELGTQDYYAGISLDDNPYQLLLDAWRDGWLTAQEIEKENINETATT